MTSEGRRGWGCVLDRFIRFSRLDWTAAGQRSATLGVYGLPKGEVDSDVPRAEKCGLFAMVMV